MAGQRIVGDYELMEQIGHGSFAVVWKAKHTRTGAEVAIKEITSDRLNPKLYENVMSEINILKRTNHPNIIRLFDTITASNRIFLVLEFCGGGDLAAYIQRHGKVSEATARHFMRQLGAGLQILRANNLIHRDLKPQNLLLSSNEGNAVLKMADFGFARSLQPQKMAETLCGSPLYMAPEILQSKKYDAKADLWSVGTILYQLVTGKPPFTGQTPVQLLHNIQRSTELRFPKHALTELHPECINLCIKLLRKDPVERLSFEEFFNHSFIAEPIRCEPVSYRLEEKLPFSGEATSFKDEPMPFILDEDPPFKSASPTGDANMMNQASPIKLLRGSGEKNVAQTSFEKKGISLRERDGSPRNNPIFDFNFKQSKAFVKEGVPVRTESEPIGFSISHSKGLLDSMEVIEKDYVLVSKPAVSTDAISFSASEQFPSVGHQSPSFQKAATVNAALPKAGSLRVTGSQADQETSYYAGVSQVDYLTRLHVLQKCAEAIADLAFSKAKASHYLEAFSIQLVCLAVWKEALSFSSKRSHGFSRNDRLATVGSESYKLPLPFFDIQENDYGVETLCSRIEQKFCSAVEKAEGLAPHLQALDGHTAIPDAVELIFQGALSTARTAAVDELMGNMASAAAAYPKAETLLYFLLVEAVLLPITPRLVLDRADKQRLRHYIDIIAARQSVCAGK